MRIYSKHIAFVDTETGNSSLYDIGAVKEDGSVFHSQSTQALTEFLEGVEYVGGHNILQHDLGFLAPLIGEENMPRWKVIDTLYLSPLLFPEQRAHNLSKEEKVLSDELNNPVNDALKARDLFHAETEAFCRLDKELKDIFHRLLSERAEFSAFFHYLGYRPEEEAPPEDLILKRFKGEVCESAPFARLVADMPVELAYCLSMLNRKERYTITPPWILQNFPAMEAVVRLLRGKACLKGCAFCNESLDIHKGLKRYFGYNSYRVYDGEPLQQKAVQAAVNHKSLLAIFPTGGGKSITFQVPALMSGANERGLTVVISPLQSLMKDQVDNLRNHGISEAATINGLLDPIERQEAFEKVESGRASLLYISPESLRSRTIERLLLDKRIIRFVVDEAHCFSSWGQDFRVDYLYIGDFIRMLQDKKGLAESIPVSCFTATARQQVIRDITDYFAEKLGLKMEQFNSAASRTNLHYHVLERENETQKYHTLRELIRERNCPTIVYVSRTDRATQIAKRLTQDDIPAKAFHGKMQTNDKTANQDEFIRGDVQVIVATSAFGMGVDKKDVGLVVHFDISDSLENYVQEAGRAGRDDSISASCYVLFNEDDLNKHFILLNQTQLHLKEIQQVWTAIKKVTTNRAAVSQSALEIARLAGWDDTVMDIETRVITAISALENAGYLKRGQNIPRVFANSILSRTAQEAIEKIRQSPRFDEKQKEQATRIIKKLISTRSRKHANEETAESRIDYISDHLGISKKEVITAITLLREEKILGDAKDLTAYIKKGESGGRSRDIVKLFNRLEIYLASQLEDHETTLHWKSLQEAAEEQTGLSLSPDKLKVIINFWTEKGWVKRVHRDYSKRGSTLLPMLTKDTFAGKINNRHDLAEFIINFLYTRTDRKGGENLAEELIEFSVLELKERYLRSNSLFGKKVTTEDVEQTLFYLSRIGALPIEGGFMVLYNQLHLVRTETDNKKRYKQEDYRKLEDFYANKIQQIHIVGEYAAKMVEDYAAALRFVDDYFHLNYSAFLQRYFPGKRGKEIGKKVTPKKYRELFGELSPSQLEIINDTGPAHIVVAAGPGSGKTKVLVHKLASLLMMEDLKHEQLLMLTFSRAATSEFRQRLHKLVGNAVGYIEIKTFHSYCFDLLGKVGTAERSASAVSEATQRIRSGEVDLNRITKAVLVIDEAQDMTQAEFDLVAALIERNDGLRVIAVGDDDQNIYSFREETDKDGESRKPDSLYLRQLIEKHGARQYNLLANYRSKENLVLFANQFAQRIPNRLKRHPVEPVQHDNGNIRIIRHVPCNMVVPVAEDVASAPLSGTTCVITQTNEEALQIACLLQEKDLPVKLIQGNSGFGLGKLIEIAYFTSLLYAGDSSFLISDEQWEEAKNTMKRRFGRSVLLPVCSRILDSFEKAYPHKYRTDWEAFLAESELETFFPEEGETIYVSTIHKAKGKEFENVFLMLDGVDIHSEDEIRKIYVAITRARRNLAIHLNGNYLDGISVGGLTRMNDTAVYHSPDHLAFLLDHRHVVLNFFSDKECLVDKLQSGDRLLVTESGCATPSGNKVVHFSQRFLQFIRERRLKGYVPTKARVNFIVYWTRREDRKEIKVVLPEVIFEAAPSPE